MAIAPLIPLVRRSLGRLTYFAGMVFFSSLMVVQSLSGAKVAEPIDRLPADLELALFRIVQEALTNVRRHSGSQTASIRLERKSDAIVLEIQDQGQGLASNKRISDPNDAEELIEMGVGIPGMQQRLRQRGGRLTIDSSNEGTTLIAVVPIVDGTSHPASTSLASSELEAAARRAV